MSVPPLQFLNIINKRKINYSSDILRHDPWQKILKKLDYQELDLFTKGYPGNYVDNLTFGKHEILRPHFDHRIVEKSI